MCFNDIWLKDSLFGRFNYIVFVCYNELFEYCEGYEIVWLKDNMMNCCEKKIYILYIWWFL